MQVKTDGRSEAIGFERFCFCNHTLLMTFEWSLSLYNVIPLASTHFTKSDLLTAIFHIDPPVARVFTELSVDQLLFNTWGICQHRPLQLSTHFLQPFIPDMKSNICSYCQCWINTRASLIMARATCWCCEGRRGKRRRGRLCLTVLQEVWPICRWFLLSSVVWLTRRQEPEGWSSAPSSDFYGGHRLNQGIFCLV